VAGITAELDNRFPRVDGGEPVEAKLVSIRDYLYLLTENLGWTLRHLDWRNFNPAAIRKLTEPIYASIKDNAGRLTQLAVTAEGLDLRVTNAEGWITEFEVTANGILSSVSDLEGNLSLYSQRAERIDWIVQSGSDSSNFTLTAKMASLVSEHIILAGAVTFNDLEYKNGYTRINGGNITTGQISGIVYRLESPGGIYAYSEFYGPGQPVAGIYMDGTTLVIEAMSGVRVNGHLFEYSRSAEEGVSDEDEAD